MKTLSQSVERIAQSENFRKALNDLLDDRRSVDADSSKPDSRQVRITGKSGEKVLVVRRVFAKK